MTYDSDNMLQTAQAIIKLNKHAAFFTPASLVNYMTSFAERELASMDHNGYAGTYGFYLSTFNHPNGGRGVHATIAPWLVV